MTDTISDMLTRIRNASRAYIPVVEVPHSRMKESIAHVLRQEGYVSEVSVVHVSGAPKIRLLRLKLRCEGRKSTVEGLRRVSRPGIRHYVGCSHIPRVRSGLGVSILSTSQGVMSGGEARKRKLGGELLCVVW